MILFIMEMFGVSYLYCTRSPNSLKLQQARKNNMREPTLILVIKAQNNVKYLQISSY